MKKTFTAALALALATSAFAQNEILRIELNDGTTQDVEVAAIKQMTFADSEENPQSPAEKIAGEYSGISDVAVGTMWNYQSETIKVKIEANADGTINFTWCFQLHLLPALRHCHTVRFRLTMRMHSGYPHK